MSADKLRYDQVISRTLAHKWSLDEVFLTDFATVGPQQMVIAAQIPRAHVFYCEFPTAQREPDLAVLIEMCRQACFVVAHEQFDVPLEGNVYQFLFQDLDARAVTDRPTLDTSHPVNLVIESTVERVWKRGRVPSGLAWHFLVRCEAVALAEVRIRMMWIDRAKWREMRNVIRRGRDLPEARPAAPLAPTHVAPAEVGRNNPENVVLARIDRDGDAFTAAPRIDIRHPVLFDHPIDHIYGMVQLELGRQLATAAVSRSLGGTPADLELSGARTRFLTVAEFDLDTLVTARILADTASDGRPHPAGTPLSLLITQGDRVASESTLWIRPRPTHAARPR